MKRGLLEGSNPLSMTSFTTVDSCIGLTEASSLVSTLKREDARGEEAGMALDKRSSLWSKV